MDEIGGQKVVVTKDQINRANRRLKPCRLGQQGGQQACVAAGPLMQGGGIVADDVKGPEHLRRAAQVVRDHAVGGFHQRDRLGAQARVLKIGRCQGAAFDKGDHQRARFVIQHRRRHPGQRSRATGRQFAVAQDVVQGNVVTDADNRLARAVLHHEVQIGDAAAQGRRRHLARPARQRHRPLNWCHVCRPLARMMDGRARPSQPRVSSPSGPKWRGKKALAQAKIVAWLSPTS